MPSSRHRQRLETRSPTAWFVVGALVLAAAGFWSYPLLRGTQEWRRALAEADREDWASARTHFEACLPVWPKDGELRFRLARTCRRLGDLAAAEEHLRAVERLGSDTDAVDLELALLEAQRGNVRAVESSLIRLLLSGHEEETDILEALVRGYFDQHLLAKVTQWAGVWVERYPADWRPHFHLGRSSEMAKQLPSAIDEYLAVLKLDPNHLEARRRLGDVYRRNGQPLEGVHHLRACLALQPDDLDTTLKLTRCLIDVGKAEEARDLLTRRLNADGERDALLLQLRGEAALNLEGPAAALPWLKKAEAVAPKEGGTIILLAQAYRELGDQDQADKYERKRDDLQQLSQQLDKSLDQIKAYPEAVLPRFEAGRALMRLGLESQGVRWLRSVLEIDPDHLPTHEVLADYYENHGDRELARYHRDRAQGKR